MFSKYLAILIICCCWIGSLFHGAATVAATAVATDPIVETTNGKVVGRSHNNGAYYSFESIPYAEPPVGENRFEAPKPLKQKWSGVLDGKLPPPMCMQWSGTPGELDDRLMGVEDCLYVNVYTPKLPTGASEQQQNQLLPVMVFIHGGGLMWGSSNSYGEANIMNEAEMVLVKMNYRLGPLGFLSTEDDEIPGNMGLKDQLLALQWVQDNIRAFGGDPEKVLLAGFSAGGASVQFHLTSALSRSRRLFATAASFSGSALSPCMISLNALEKAKRMALYVGCSPDGVTTTAAIKSCLQHKPAAYIVRSVAKFLKIFYNPFSVFGPVIERRSPSQVVLSFLTDTVENLMSAGEVAQVPWLISRTANDGGYSAAEFLAKDEHGKEYIHMLQQRWTELAPILLFYKESMPPLERQKKSNNLRRDYFGRKQISVEAYPQLEQIYTDELYAKPMDKSVQLYANHSQRGSVFGYIYDNPAVYGNGQILSQRDDYEFGTVHGDDVYLIFNVATRSKCPYREDEVRISKNLIQMLSDFAKTGIPKFAGHVIPQISNTSSGLKYTRISRNEVTNFVVQMKGMLK